MQSGRGRDHRHTQLNHERSHPHTQFSFFTGYGGVLAWGLRCILTFICNFLFGPHFVPLFRIGSRLFGSPSRLCNLLYPPFFSFVFQLGWFFSFYYPLSFVFTLVSLSAACQLYSHSNYCYYCMFFITLSFVFLCFQFIFLLWRTWEGSIHLFYNMGKGSAQEVLGDFKVGNGHFVYLKMSRVFVFSGLFYYRFLIMAVEVHCSLLHPEGFKSVHKEGPSVMTLHQHGNTYIYNISVSNSQIKSPKSRKCMMYHSFLASFALL